MMIEINQLVKRYGDLVALNHFDLQVKEGEILGLLGPNGSGKTTAIHCMLSLLRFDKGTIHLFGQEMTPDNYAIKAKIGVVPQEVAVFDELTVYENINYFCGLYVADKQKRQTLIAEVVALVGLETFLTFYPNQLSGGLKRRLNIACGIAHKPDLIFLDEPTVAVDPQSRNKILESIKVLNRQGATIVYTTHYMEEVEILCDRIVIMDQGQVIAQGTKEALKDMVRTTDRLTIAVPFLPEAMLQQIKSQVSAEDIRYTGGELIVTSTHLQDDLLPILTLLQEAALSYGKISTKEATLNDVFLEITGKALRD
ncbi:ABC transporter ATP-binding protein [Enterococcus sp.]|uniref:ABC transporter ATP-binding protein n=1 Tax=Enterococcus sp. TaxID=35783 RepID=UPI000EC037AB|nr:ABC transporter ATP-binding protein [Enterococcus sp.]HCE13427.1 ABC transporter ATP-binding protein [Enterococcus sp.]